MQDLSIDPQKGSLLSLPLLVGMILLVAVPHWLLWRENAVLIALRSVGPFGLLGIFVFAIVAHEALHGITWKVAARLKISDIRYGVLWKALTPYAHPKVPIPARAYRLGAAMPGVVLGLVPAVVGLATGSALLSGWGALFLSFACGDLLILLKIRPVPPDALVRDHPTRFGCEVVEMQAGASP